MILYIFYYLFSKDFFRIGGTENHGKSRRKDCYYWGASS